MFVVACGSDITRWKQRKIPSTTKQTVNEHRRPPKKWNGVLLAPKGETSDKHGARDRVLTIKEG